MFKYKKLQNEINNINNVLNMQKKQIQLLEWDINLIVNSKSFKKDLKDNGIDPDIYYRIKKLEQKFIKNLTTNQHD